jgi:UDP-glucuronate 4-epimerase
MRLLLTGGAGFIGSHLLERLAPAHDVVVLDDFNDYYDPRLKRANLDAARRAGRFEVVEGDLRDGGVLARAFDLARPDAVIHLAARAGVRASLAAPELYSSVNVAGTLSILEQCRRRGVGKVLFASSSSVYGDSPHVPYREEEPCAPISPYGVTKLVGEQYARVYARLHGIRITALRFFTVYGPRQRPDMAIRLFAERIERGEEIPVYGDGSMRRDFTYIDDILAGILGALARDDDFAVYNLGESRTIELRELIAILERALGKGARIRRLPEQPGDVKQTYADVSQARANLGYAPSVPVEEGIRRFVAWLRSVDAPPPGA